MDQRDLPAAQGDPAAPVRGYAGGAGAAQPVRDQHRRLPRSRRDDDTLGEPRRALRPLERHADPTTPTVRPQYGDAPPPAAIPLRPVRHGVQPDRHQRGAGLLVPPQHGGNPTTTPRFFIELVNTLTSPETRTSPTNNASILDLSGFLVAGAPTPWDGACWDIIFAKDDAASRPDPISGQLQSGGTFYGLVPFNQAAFTMAARAMSRSTPSLRPPGTTAVNFFGNNYFLTIGNPLADLSSESQPFHQPPLTASALLTLAATYDPVRLATAPPVPTAPVGALPLAPNVTPPTANLPGPIPDPDTTPPTPASGVGKFYWVCLRRPADPFAPVSATNPMIVVDSMRFPYIEGGGNGTASPFSVTQGNNQIYSYQRIQPYRGGHAVPSSTGDGHRHAVRLHRADRRADHAIGELRPVRPRHSAANYITKQIYHTLGYPNDGGFTFNPPGVPSRPCPHRYAARRLGLLRVQRSRLHQRLRADARSRLPAWAVHQAVRRIRPVADQRDAHLHAAAAATPLAHALPVRLPLPRALSPTPRIPIQLQRHDESRHAPHVPLPGR